MLWWNWPPTVAADMSVDDFGMCKTLIDQRLRALREKRGEQFGEGRSEGE